MATIFGIITALSVFWIGGGILIYVNKVLTSVGKAQEQYMLSILERIKHPMKHPEKTLK